MAMLINILPWALTALSLAGTALVTKRRAEGFILWCVSNIGWIVIDYRAGLNSQAVLFIAYLALSVYGIWEWTHEKRRPERD